MVKKIGLGSLMTAILALGISGPMAVYGDTVSTAVGQGADAFTYKHLPDNVYGTGTAVNTHGADQWGYEERGFLRFDLSGILSEGEEFKTATLWLYVKTAVAGYWYFGLYGLDDGCAGDLSGGWSEYTLTWNNQPTTTGALLDSMQVASGVTQPAGWVSFSTNALVDFLDANTNGLVTIRIQRIDDKGSLVCFYSKENGSNVPYIEYTKGPKAPVFSPASKYIAGPRDITLTSPIAGATIYYTTDGNDPTTGSATYSNPISVDVGTTLKAMTVTADGSQSRVVSVSYALPPYSRPGVIAQTQKAITVDGDLSDWADANWVALDQNYNGNGATDVTSAYYAAKWGDNGNKVYVAVKVKDTAYKFTDSYDAWNTRDAAEFYIHTTSTTTPAYGPDCTTAQQYVVGVKNSDHTQVWTSLWNSNSVPESAGFQAAGRAGDDGWIYYEVAMTPYQFFGGMLSPAQDNVVSTLKAGDVIGLDVCIASNDGTNYTGMKSENTMTGKSDNYNQFAMHIVATDAPFLSEKWGPIIPNGTTNSAYYLNNNTVDGCALGCTIGSGLWELGKDGVVVHSLADTSSMTSVVKVGDWMYYALGTLSKTSFAGWEAGTAVTVNDTQSFNSMVTDGTYIYNSTTRNAAPDQVSKYSIDPETGELNLVWTTTGIEETAVRGMCYYHGDTDYIYAVSGGRNPVGSFGNVAHIYAIRTDSGEVIDMGAITHMGQAYQIVRVGKQLWVAEAYTVSVAANCDGEISMYDLTNDTTLASTTPARVCNPDGIRQIYGLAVDGNFVWLAGPVGQVCGYEFTQALTPGDANGDGVVDVGDLGILAANYGKTSGAIWAQGDFNGDGKVDVGDLGILAANYGKGAKGAANFNADYAKVFGTTAATDEDAETADDTSASTLCSGLGLPLVAGLLLAGLMLGGYFKLEE